MKKKRITIPEKIAAEILFLSDRTCCVCNVRGKQVQIHHIDENPANNKLQNLSVLCFDCHDQTMIKGGFGRKLESSQIYKYRKDWHDRVSARKAKADEIASIQTVTGNIGTVIVPSQDYDYLDYKTNNDPKLLIKYLSQILIVHNAQLIIAKTKWDSGGTFTMNQGNNDMIDFYEEVLIELSTFYPKGHFNKMTPNKFISDLISNLFRWHRLVLEPDGIGTGGTIVSTMTGGNVMEDLKQKVIDMVVSLISPYSINKDFDFVEWRKKWLDEDS